MFAKLMRDHYKPKPQPKPFPATVRREKEPLDGVLRREQEQVELRGSAIVRTTWRVSCRPHRPFACLSQCCM